MESKNLNQQYDHSYPKDYRGRNFITDSSDINKTFSVITQDTFPATLSDGFLNLDVTPNAKSFKMTLPIKARTNKRASGENFDKRKTTCIFFMRKWGDQRRLVLR